MLSPKRHVFIALTFILKPKMPELRWRLKYSNVTAEHRGLKHLGEGKPRGSPGSEEPFFFFFFITRDITIHYKKRDNSTRRNKYKQENKMENRFPYLQ